MTCMKRHTVIDRSDVARAAPRRAPLASRVRWGTGLSEGFRERDLSMAP